MSSSPLPKRSELKGLRVMMEEEWVDLKCKLYFELKYSEINSSLFCCGVRSWGKCIKSLTKSTLDKIPYFCISDPTTGASLNQEDWQIQILKDHVKFWQIINNTRIHFLPFRRILSFPVASGCPWPAQRGRASLAWEESGSELDQLTR